MIIRTISLGIITLVAIVLVIRTVSITFNDDDNKNSELRIRLLCLQASSSCAKSVQSVQLTAIS